VLYVFRSAKPAVINRDVSIEARAGARTFVAGWGLEFAGVDPNITVRSVAAGTAAAVPW
jgi:hypothetical protein